MSMSLICVRATWHRMIRFRQSEDIYIQRQLSPRLRKQGGQQSSSTSIHYVSITKNDGDRRTHRHPNCHTVKPCGGSEVHLLLNNQETLWDFFVREIWFTGWIKYWLFHCLCIWTVTTSAFVFDLCILQVLLMELGHNQICKICSNGFRCMAILATGHTLDWNELLNQVLHTVFFCPLDRMMTLPLS